jgi:hypothetical protein
MATRVISAAEAAAWDNLADAARRLREVQEAEASGEPIDATSAPQTGARHRPRAPELEAAHGKR